MEKERSIITDKLVKQLTRKTMEEWFLLLDAKGAKKMGHEAIFDLVAGIKGLQPLGEWNQNLLTTTYEWSRGLKERGQKKDGFEISVSKTMNVPVAALYQFWTDETLQQKWLPGKKINITKATENKSVRVAWPEDTRVSVDLYPKGEGKAQMVVQHMKIIDSEQAFVWKQYWSERLEALKALLA